MAYYLNPADYMDPGDAEPDYTGRCEGTRHRKCGRFCGRSFYCTRCQAEVEAEWRETMVAESRAADEAFAREQAWYEAEEREARALGKIAAWDAEMFEDHAPAEDLAF